MSYQKRNHKYIDRTISSTTGKYIYKYAPTGDKKKFKKEAKRSEDYRNVDELSYYTFDNIDKRIPESEKKRIKDAITPDIEASRGKNRYVMKDGHTSSHSRPKVYSGYMYQKDFEDRKNLRKKKLSDIKSGKIHSDGKKFVEKAILKRIEYKKQKGYTQ